MIDGDDLRNQAVVPETLRRRGRPKSQDGPMERVDTRIPVDLHDDLCRVAVQRDVPVSAIFREALVAYRRRLTFRR